ncbi:peptidase [Synechococcus phage ACG-2014h]|uniref:Peptidase n=1 Tax=Synechococcus phage ACG-2014h TaxID=1340810 RepID=V5USP1_9CAUD|nr:peptidase [Synechococcus phage ACG-2014h]AHB80542.1 peptidase [Synechococcus phage ACG-2014h]
MLNQEIKGNLARLLATENLIVEHRKVSTASFDVDRRVLTLPNWDKASSVVYDMLVGHEVGHALFTPNEDWRDAADCPKDYLNVIEDARIEKLMKRKYPGLRKSFAGGYKELNDADFFSIEGADFDTFSLIDRINLHFKIGATAMVPFSIEEKVFVARTDIAETFEEVCKIAADIYNFSNETETPMTHEEMLEEAQQREDENNDESQSEQEPQEQQPQSQPQIKQQSDANMEDDEEEGEESNAGERSETQRAFDDAADKLTNRHASNPVYVEIPDSVDLPTYIADWTEVHDWIDQCRINRISDERYECFDEVDKSYVKFRKESQKEVNYLVKEFECRKSADAYARSGQSKTGVLDTSKLHTYKYNEDLFKKVTVLPDGKNHGLLFLLDWSGSMGKDIFATVKQVLNLTAFCKKVQIPFEVYAFTNEWYIARRISDGQNHYLSDEEYYAEKKCEEGKIFLQKDVFHLMNFVSSRSNAKNYDRMCLNLYREAYAYSNHVAYPTTVGVGLSGTPLNEGIVMLNYIIPQFKKQNDLQKVNVCILTDGEACQSAYGRKYYSDHRDEFYVRPRRLDYNTVLRDRKTGRVYAMNDGWGDMTNTFITQLRDRNAGVNVLGFRIMGGNGLSSFVSMYGNLAFYDQVQKQWKKNKSAIIPSPKSYTALYAIKNTSIDEDTEFDVESGAKKGEITRAFKKMLSSKSANKKLLNSFVEYVA